MAISKVIYKSSSSAQGVTWIDATPATAAASDITSPKTAMLANGVVTQGTGSGGSTPVIDSLSVTPSTSQQTFNASGVDGYKPVVVAAMPSGTAGTPSATKGTVSNHSVTITPSVTNTTGYITGSTKTGTAVTVTASELVSGNKEITANGTNIDVADYATVSVAVPSSGANIDTKTVTASNYPVSISFSSMKGTPKAFFLRSTSQISSSGSTSYYYVIDLVYDGNTNNYCDGNCFRIGSTRRVDPITTTASGGVVSGYTWSYSGSTLTITSSAASRSASPGAFNNGYKLVYIY